MSSVCWEKRSAIRPRAYREYCNLVFAKGCKIDSKLAQKPLELAPPAPVGGGGGEGQSWPSCPLAPLAPLEPLAPFAPLATLADQDCKICTLSKICKIWSQTATLQSKHNVVAVLVVVAMVVRNHQKPCQSMLRRPQN